MDYIVIHIHNSTTSFDTCPHESTWIYGTNYVHVRTVDSRRTLRMILHALGCEAIQSVALQLL